MKPRIAVICCMYGRHVLTDYVFNYYRQMKSDKFDLIKVACGSEGDISKNIAKKNGWHYAESENMPLTTKHDNLIYFTKQFKPDCVVLIGSDDLLQKELFEFYADYLIPNKEIECFGWKDCYVYGLHTNEALYWPGYSDYQRKPFTTGLARYYSKSLLDRLQWHIWDEEEWPNSCDAVCQRKIDKNKAYIHSSFLYMHNFVMMDFKQKGNLTDFNGIRSGCININPDKILSIFNLTKEQIKNFEV